MKEKKNRFYKAVLQKLLVLLGFGTTLVFMACYGPPPSHGSMEELPDEFAIEGDSCQMNANKVDTTHIEE